MTRASALLVEAQRFATPEKNVDPSGVRNGGFVDQVGRLPFVGFVFCSF